MSKDNIAFIYGSQCQYCKGPGIVLNGRTRMVHEPWCKFARNLVELGRVKQWAELRKVS